MAGRVVTRPDLIGKRQGQVLMVAWAMMPRWVDARILAVVADPDSDLTRGRRVLASLESRGMLVREVARMATHSPLVRYQISEAGMEALKVWLSRWQPKYPGE